MVNLSRKRLNLYSMKRRKVTRQVFLSNFLFASSILLEYIGNLRQIFVEFFTLFRQHELINLLETSATLRHFILVLREEQGCSCCYLVVISSKKDLRTSSEKQFCSFVIRLIT